jgi:competence protein ComEC
LFVASVIAFSAGIYLQSLYSLPFTALLLSALLSILLALLGGRASRRVSSIFIIVAFALTGAMRLSLLENRQVIAAESGKKQVFIGSVVESAPHLKTLSLSFPEEMKGMRVAFLTGLDLSLSDEVRLSAVLVNLDPTFRNPGTTSWRLTKRIEGIHYQIKGDVLSIRPGNDWIGRLRRYFRKNIDESGARHSDILKALTVGDRTAIPPEKNNLFTRTGTSHVLAISGFNVGIITGFFFFLVRLIIRRVRRFRLSGSDTRYAALLVIPSPFIFMLIAGAGVSVIRAAIMTGLFMIAVFLEREKDFYATTALSALVILLIYPQSLFTPSFQLTFASLLSIVMFMTRLFPVMTRMKSRPLAWTASTIFSTAAATLGTAPIVIHYFFGINLICIIHNLITIPLIGIGATVCALVGMLLPVGRQLLLLGGFFVDVNMWILKALDVGYIFPIIRPNFLDVLLYYGALITALNLGRIRLAKLLLPMFLLFVAIQALVFYHERFNQDLHVHFIDVGSGDATLIEVPGGTRILIDGGGFPGSDFDVGQRVIAPFLLHRKVGRLDYVINTHPHADHIGGLPSVLRDFHVSHLVTSGPFPNNPAFLRLAEIARSRRIPHLIWREGDGIKIGDFRLRTLHPQAGQQPGDLNNASLVLRIDYRKTSFILPGDIRNDVEGQLVLSGLPLRADILKLAHHGSSLSNSPAFVYAVRPGLTILSTSGKQKGLPGREVVRKIQRLDLPILRTDRHGLIEVHSDGSRIRWKTYARD